MDWQSSLSCHLECVSYFGYRKNKEDKSINHWFPVNNFLKKFYGNVSSAHLWFLNLLIARRVVVTRLLGRGLQWQEQWKTRSWTCSNCSLLIVTNSVGGKTLWENVEVATGDNEEVLQTQGQRMRTLPNTRERYGGNRRFQNGIGAMLICRGELMSDWRSETPPLLPP